MWLKFAHDSVWWMAVVLWQFLEYHISVNQTDISHVLLYSPLTNFKVPFELHTTAIYHHLIIHAAEHNHTLHVEAHLSHD